MSHTVPPVRVISQKGNYNTFSGESTTHQTRLYTPWQVTDHSVISINKVFIETFWMFINQNVSNTSLKKKIVPYRIPVNIARVLLSKNPKDGSWQDSQVIKKCKEDVYNIDLKNRQKVNVTHAPSFHCLLRSACRHYSHVRTWIL